MNQTLSFFSKIRFFYRLILRPNQLIGGLCTHLSKWNWANFWSAWHIYPPKIRWPLEFSRPETWKPKISTENQASFYQLFSTVKNQFYILIRLSIALQYESLRKCTFESVSLLATLLLYLTWSRHLKWFISEGIRIWRDSLQNSFISVEEQRICWCSKFGPTGDRTRIARRAAIQ